MRIAILCDYPVHTLPGYEADPRGRHATWLPPLSRELSTRDVDLDLHWITCTKEVAEPVHLVDGHQTFHLVPRGKLAIEMLSGYWHERRTLQKLLHKLQPDLVHAWGTEQGYALAALDFSPDALISMQGILQTYCKATRMPWLARIQARHEATALSKARHLTVESPWGADQLAQLAPQAQIHFLEYGAALECFDIERIPVAAVYDRRSLSAAGDPSSPTPEPDGHRPPLQNIQHSTSNIQHSSAAGAPQSPTSETDGRRPPLQNIQHSTSNIQHSSATGGCIVLYVGSLNHLKGTDTLLKAFLDPRLAHTQLVAIGNGDPHTLCDKLPPNAHFTGYLSEAKVREWMAKAWCLVHPTRADTSPNCVKEARVIGLPVVTTPNGGQTQYVEHLNSGFIHSAGDVEGLIQGILTCTADRQTSLDMGKHGRADCRQQLHPTTTATRLLEIYTRFHS